MQSEVSQNSQDSLNDKGCQEVDEMESSFFDAPNGAVESEYKTFSYQD